MTDVRDDREPRISDGLGHARWLRAYDDKHPPPGKVHAVRARPQEPRVDPKALRAELAAKDQSATQAPPTQE